MNLRAAMFAYLSLERVQSCICAKAILIKNKIAELYSSVVIVLEPFWLKIITVLLKWNNGILLRVIKNVL